MNALSVNGHGASAGDVWHLNRQMRDELLIENPAVLFMRKVFIQKSIQKLNIKSLFYGACRHQVWFVYPCVMALGMVVSGCASEHGYSQAFSERVAVQGSERAVGNPSDQVLLAAKQALVKQGFAIGGVDLTTGIIKASRNLPDSSNQNLSYTINATVGIGIGDKSDTTNVAVSANQQTILHRKSHTWWHLLWMIPVFPTSTQYETVVTKEGDITDIAFYNDFFSMLGKSLSRSSEKSQQSGIKSDG